MLKAELSEGMKSTAVFRILLTVCLLTCGFTGIRAQNKDYYIDRIDWEDGFYQNTVDCIIQDSLGFIFLATSNGLYRYDGYDFIKYPAWYGRSGGLMHNLVFSLEKDHQDNIWVGTDGGLYKYNSSNELFHFYEETENFGGIFFQFIDSEDRLWLGTPNGYYIGHLPENEKDSIQFMHLASIHTGNFTREGFIYETENGYFVANTPQGIIRVSANFQSSKVPLYVNGKELTTYQANDFFVNRRGDGFLATDKGLFRLESSGMDSKFNKIHLQIPGAGHQDGNITVEQVSEDNNGNLLLLSEELGLINYSLFQGTRIHPIFEDYRETFTSDAKYSMFIDRTGMLWITSTNNGLFLVNSQLGEFDVLHKDMSNPGALNDYRINCFCKDSFGTLWIGTMNGGINILTLENEDSKSFIRLEEIPGMSGSLPSDHITCIVEEEVGSIWVGSSMGLTHILYEDDFRNARYYNYSADTLFPDSLQSPFIASLCYSNDHRLWIGTKNGLSLFVKGPVPGKGSFVNFIGRPSDTCSICSDEIFSICEGADSCLWIGTNGGGLNRLEVDPKMEPSYYRYTNFRANPSDPESLTNDYIYTVYEDRSQNLWIGNWGGGLNKMVADKPGLFKHYRIKEGLPDLGIYGILEDEFGFLWISTDMGISRFDPNKEVFTNFNVKDGLHDNNFRKFAYYKDRFGQMYFGGSTGYTSFFPLSIDPSNTTATPVITKLFLLDKEIKTGEEVDSRLLLQTSISRTQSLSLNYHENSFMFIFSSLYYFAPERCRFQYMLENFDSEWNNSDGKMRFATYTKVPHGHYTFKLKASNSHGIYNEQPLILQISIAPPIWLSTAAYFLYTVLLITLIFVLIAGYKKRSRVRKEELIESINREKEKKMEQEKMEFYTNIAHELRTPVSLMLGPIKELTNQDQSREHREYLHRLMERNGKRLLALIDQLLYFRKAETGSMRMEVSNYDFKLVMDEIIQVFDLWLHERKIKVSLDLPNDRLPVFFDKEKIYKIFSNLIYNAIKYSDEGSEIRISARILETTTPTFENPVSCLEVTVSDHGKGIPTDKIEQVFKRFYRGDKVGNTGSGIGLSLAKRLIEMHHGQISVESEVNVGTTFTCLIPRRKEYYREEDLIQESGFTIAGQEIYFPQIDNKGYRDKEQHPTGNQPMIMIIDDEEEMNNYLASIFSGKYRVMQAGDAEEGLSRILEDLPDVVICDIMLPGINGIELCRKIKSDQITSHIPVLLITAQTNENAEISGLKAEANDYLMKPFDPDVIQTKVDNQLRYIERLHKKYSRTVSLEPGPGEVEDMEEAFLVKAMQICIDHLSDSDFSTKVFENEVGMSRSQLYKKLTLLTGLSPNKFIRNVRIKRAADLLRDSKLSVSEITYKVGFNDLKYFRKCFTDEFGVAPSEFRKSG